MPRNQPGYRYPHATTSARKHECKMCNVVGAIAVKAMAGEEEWGTPHQLPPLDVTEDRAEEIRDWLFNGRNCRKAARAAGSGPLSVSVTFLTPDGQLVNSPAVRRTAGYVLTIRVWARDRARLEIARRAQAGEQLHYNPLRGN